MAEVYPSDNELLSLTCEPQTGVEYIATGQSPYYLHFRRLISRLILAARKANELRVYDAGNLDIGVKPGAFWLGTQIVDYAGQDGVTLADDKPQIYLYLDSLGNLVTDEYTSFPEMSSMPHIRLAVVSTSSGDITSVVDCRASHGFTVPTGAGGSKRNIDAHTSSSILTEQQSGSVNSNTGATGAVTLTLPLNPASGTYYTFAVQASYDLNVDPQTAAIRDDSGQTADKCKYSNVVGSCLTLVADSNGDWVTTSKNGTWTEEL